MSLEESILVGLKEIAARALEPLEKERKAYQFLRQYSHDGLDFGPIVKGAHELPTEVLGALQDWLPPGTKPLLYGSQAPSTQQLEHSEETDPDLISEDYRNVLLLGSSEDQEANFALLQGAKFEPLRVSPESDLSLYFESSVCGIVVGKGWWTGLDHGRHEDSLKHIVRFSTVAWLRVDTDGMACAQDADRIIQDARLAEPKMGECTFAPGSRITTPELLRLKKAAINLSASQSLSILPRELSPPLSALIAAATRKRTFVNQPPAQLGVAVLPGGKSQAQAFLFVPDSGTPPFVAKIDARERLEDEVRRFQTFIQPFNDSLRPELHSHGTISAIVFSMVRAGVSISDAAPSMHGRLTELMSSEHGNVVAPAEQNLRDAISHLTGHLASMAERSPGSTAFGNKCWFGLEPLEQMETIGGQWNWPEIAADIEGFRTMATNSRAVLESEKNRSVVHGDLNLRNVLLPADNLPILIDYACTGPGHPAYDLARFGVAFLFEFLRPNVDENLLSDLLVSILAGQNLASLQNTHSRLLSFPINRLAVHALIASRSAALQLMQTLGCQNRDEHWRAMLVFLTIQSIFRREFQATTMRALLKALTIDTAKKD